MSKTNVLIPYIEVENKIATIRKLQVIADADVAELYGVGTKGQNQTYSKTSKKRR